MVSGTHEAWEGRARGQWLILPGVGTASHVPEPPQKWLAVGRKAR